MLGQSVTNRIHMRTEPNKLSDSPFSLENDSTYLRWRAQKLEGYPLSADELLVEVSNPMLMTKAEREQIIKCCRKTNMAVYASHTLPDRDDILTIAAQFGLTHLDKHLCADQHGVSVLRDDPGGQQQEYIPYSNKAINWHTDGYYNSADHQIRAMMLHCKEQAATGGGNELLDHELLYIALRDQDKQFIATLMAHDAMTIPANVQHGVEIRPALSGPVFSINPQTGDLHCRYTARTRSIEWRQDAPTLEAVTALEAALKSADLPKFSITMAPGQGLISNNVLHTRTSFTDAGADQQRLVYRVRSYDRVKATGVLEHESIQTVA